ncbi:MAG: hypothetical protein MO852_11445 [Candidatus Devosia euplotis]|nr:hypothetical protein [Candidatus Devosia euplotis]
MNDSVVKFRKIEKKLEPKPPRRELMLPGWVPFVALVVLALAIYAAQNAGLIGG